MPYFTFIPRHFKNDRLRLRPHQSVAPHGRRHGRSPRRNGRIHGRRPGSPRRRSRPLPGFGRRYHRRHPLPRREPRDVLAAEQLAAYAATPTPIRRGQGKKPAQPLDRRRRTPPARLVALADGILAEGRPYEIRTDFRWGRNSSSAKSWKHSIWKTLASCVSRGFLSNSNRKALVHPPLLPPQRDPGTGANRPGGLRFSSGSGCHLVWYLKSQEYGIDLTDSSQESAPVALYGAAARG